MVLAYMPQGRGNKASEHPSFLPLWHPSSCRRRVGSARLPPGGKSTSPRLTSALRFSRWRRSSGHTAARNSPRDQPSLAARQRVLGEPQQIPRRPSRRGRQRDLAKAASASDLWGSPSPATRARAAWLRSFPPRGIPKSAAALSMRHGRSTVGHGRSKFRFRAAEVTGTEARPVSARALI
eukprot:scaffold301_cov243-Pinguiococcus_pyrenoidosus.AAC.77